MEMITEHFHQDQAIVNEGDMASSFYIVKSGKVSIVKDGQTKAYLDSGFYFGEGALTKDFISKRSATVKARTEVECLSIGKNNFLKIFGEEVNILVERNTLRYLFRNSDVLKNFS
jgi:cGMP-dependent protein kinase 1